ncbi:CheR family methyltransferase [Hymenobacter psychrophilus]|uniref:protein-glutamate O-methyltransferase n=1 Tax=Hymenobacter psychrophilus TaxID=651662 RepID=A0A1H3LSS6_9BACT|nr:CheR family methyltransferase [Hymenobacter psychrophilus]SDY67074.1 two-component system, chemotaxis family, CheB/CheR fusion protein [Hymenobacter psychrophilus]
MPDFNPATYTEDRENQDPAGPIGVEAVPVEQRVSPSQLRVAQRQENAADKFPIVGLGGSAGALQAFEEFFRQLPARPGMAFVVVMHLVPDQPGELPAVLQRFTAMPVVEAADGLKVQPNHVYVIPPGRDLGMLHGTLLLFQPTQARGHRLPIDFFFQSLAKDARERAICIICSGMGSDGTVGLKMVMENFGMVMVQSPETAEYDSMPHSAVATEFVDYVLPAGQLPAKLVEYLHKPLLARPRRETAESASQPAHALQKIFVLIRAQTGHDFSFYKRNTVFRRIERRMNAHQIPEFTQYVRYLQENPAEVEALFRELLIGVTKFFRDPDAFQALQRQLPALLRQKPTDSVVRVWTPGCSTGEEAYSLAMLLLEGLDSVDPGRYLKIQLFATDINPAAVDFARAGLYPANITADVSPERLQRFFVRQPDGSYQITKEVRDVVIFAVHNLTKDAPFTKLDLLCCRNLLIYLSAELQKNLLPVFHYALNPSALLFLGPSENLTGYRDLFTALDMKWKISRRNDSSPSITQVVNFPFALSHHPAAAAGPATPMASSSSHKSGPFTALVQKTLLRTYAPPAVVINTKGEILYVNGRTGRYLEPAPGLGGLNLFEMAREELNYELSAAVHKASASQQTVVVERVQVQTEAGYQLLRLTVHYLQQPEQLAGLLLVAFEDQPTPRKVRTAKARPADESRDAVVEVLGKELQFTKHRLQTTIEEMESSLEELKSTNEELQSANEELQSTNEEAMTNKEEMQSLNEELMTLNMQYLSKTEELSQAANDMKNLLDATEIATVFLDNDMLIKRFTPSMSRIMHLQPADVGRPINHFASTLRYDTLEQDVRQVIDRLTSVEATVETTANEWFSMRILPYRTLDNYISGAVLTFTDVSDLKHLETRLRESTRYAESIIETMQEPLLILDAQLLIQTASQTLARQFQLDVARLRNQPLASLGPPEWNHTALREQLQALFDGSGESFDNLHLTGPQGRPIRAFARRLLSAGQATGLVLLGLEVSD